MRTRQRKIVLRVATIVATIGLTTLVLSATTWGGKPGGGTSRYNIVPLDIRSGAQWSFASDINGGTAGGAVVVGYLEDADRFADAVAWEVTVSGGTVSVAEHLLPGLPGDFGESAAFGVNDLGEIVGNAVVDGVDKAIYWQEAFSAPVLLPPLPGRSDCWAMSINNDGVVVGVSFNATGDSNRRAVAWKVGPAGNLLAGPVDLGVLSGGGFSGAGDVSNTDATSGNVRVVGSSHSTSGHRAALWEIDPDTLTPVNGPVDLGVLSGDHPSSSGYAINDQGATCGDSAPQLAFRKPYGGAMQQLVLFKPGQTWAFGINNRNEVVGRNDHYDPRRGAYRGSYGVMWQADGKVVNLDSFIDSSGWYHIHNGRAINNFGWIAGHGAIKASGESRALVMVPK